MFRRYHCILFLLSIPVLVSAQRADSSWHVAEFRIARTDTTLQLPHQFIEPASIRVFIDSLEVTSDPKLGLNPVPGTIRIPADSFPPGTLRVSYRIQPVRLKPSYALRTLNVRADSAVQRPVMVSRPMPRNVVDDMFGPGLQKSGSLTRGFTVGTNRDLTLNSGLRLQLAGRLSDDIDVVAALTDENTPIQPEGTTQTLREVDKVFVELRNPTFNATLGDFNLEVDAARGGEYGALSRKLQGVTGSVNLSSGSRLPTSVSITAASARGTYHTNQIQGIDGVQGPYRLTGRNGERRLIVVTGSERVYVNGTLMTRGESNDYTIDYAAGEVTFSSKRLITNASRIVVDFEYNERAYSRNLLGTSIAAEAGGGAVTFRASAYQESDDPDSPIEADLSDEARTILAQSGNDRFRATLPGIRFVGRDSLTGRPAGVYILKDTLIDARTVSILVYAPGDSNAFYDASFSPVDFVPPDSAGYVRSSIGVYRFAGLGAGSYLPVRFLAMPQQHRVLNLNTDVSVTRSLNIRGEFAASTFDPNRLAPAGISDGSAYTLGMAFTPKQNSIAGIDVGDVDLQLRLRQRQAEFRPLDRAENVEFGREWDVATERTSDERIGELSLGWRVRPWLGVTGSYGSLARTGQINSDRWRFDADLRDSSSRAVRYQVERIRTTSEPTRIVGSWFRQQGDASTELWGLRPGARFESEDRSVTMSGMDSLRAGSFRYVDVAPRLEYNGTGSLVLRAEVQFRSEDSSVTGSMRHASDAVTQAYSGQWSPSRTMNTSITLNLRRVRFAEEFRLRGNADGDYLLVRSQSKAAGWDRFVESDLYYEFSNQRSARLERVFVRVQQGTGNYRFLGDLNANGVADEAEFEPTRFDGEYVLLYLPGEQLLPVSDLKASVRLRLQPAKLVGSSAGFWSSLAKAVSTETFLRLDERSKDSNARNIYFLNLSSMLSAENTISGAQQIIQDLFVFEHDRDLSLRFRVSERYGLIQLVSTTERSTIGEQSLRITSRFVPELTNQTDVIRRSELVVASVASPRARDLTFTTITTEFGYRPFPQWEAGFVLGGGEGENRTSSGVTRIRLNDQAVKMIYAIPGAGQVRAEFKREEVTGRDVREALPFELTGGKPLGISWLWQTWFDYRFTTNLQLSINYAGRTEAGRSPIHTARVEARAFF